MKESKSWEKHFDFLFISLVSLLISFVMSYEIRFYFTRRINKEYFYLILIILLIEICLYFIINPYQNVLIRGKLVELKDTLILSMLNMSILVLMLFLTKKTEIYSRQIITYGYLIHFWFFYFIKIIYKKFLKSHKIKRHVKTILLVCKESEALELINSVNKLGQSIYEIVGICLDKNSNDIKEINSIPIIGNLEKMIDYLSKNWLDEVLISLPIHKIPKKIVDGLNISRITTHLVIKELDVFKGRKQKIDNLSNLKTISTQSNNQTTFQLIVKKIMDVFGGMIGSIFTIVIAIVIGPIIYMKSPGKIFYVSTRVGKNGKKFKFYKFRSMINDAEKLKDKYKNLNKISNNMMFKIDNDPRVIPGIGEFIRKTSIDEFPQFFNVLKGDMSLVGTRPPTLDEWNKYSPYYRSRLSIKPGITGLWQVSGRSNIVDFDEVVRLDNEYIDNFSIMLDIKIILKTIIKIFNTKDNGAL